MEKPQALVHAETQHEVALVAEETGLQDEPPNECLSPSVHHCDDQFATYSVPVTYSYESTIVIDPSEQNAFPQTAAEEPSVVDESEMQATPTSPSTVPANRDTTVLVE